MLSLGTDAESASSAARSSARHSFAEGSPIESSSVMPVEVLSFPPRTLFGDDAPSYMNDPEPSSGSRSARPPADVSRWSRNDALFSARELPPQQQRYLTARRRTPPDMQQTSTAIAIVISPQYGALVSERCSHRVVKSDGVVVVLFMMIHTGLVERI